MAANNLFANTLAGIDPEVFGAMLKQQAASPTVNAATVLPVASGGGAAPNRSVNVAVSRPDRLSPTVEADRVRRQQVDMDTRQNALSTVPQGLNQWAPLAGMLQGMAGKAQRTSDQQSLEELYGAYAQSQAEEAAAAQAAKQQAAEAARVQQLQDEARTRAAGMEDWQSKEQWKVDNPAPATAQEAATLAMAQAQMQNLVEQREQRGDKAQRETDAAEVTAGKKEKLKSDIMADITALLSPSVAKDMERATGSVEGHPLFPSLRQGTVDWEDRFKSLQSKLTGENLDLMTGVLSESDIGILRDIGSGGLNLRSGVGRLTEGMQGIGKGLGMEFPGAGKEVARTGTMPDGRKVIEYTDGSTEYR